MLIMMNGDFMVNFTKNGKKRRISSTFGACLADKRCTFGRPPCKDPWTTACLERWFFGISSISPWCLVKSTGFFKSLALKRAQMTFSQKPHLIGGLEPWNFMNFQKQLGMSSSQLTFHCFRGVGQPPTSHHVMFWIFLWDFFWDE